MFLDQLGSADTGHVLRLHIFSVTRDARAHTALVATE